MKKSKRDLRFSNMVVDKRQLKHIIVWAFRNHGIARAANMADKLKDLGFHYATKAGISLSLEDLRIPPIKKTLLKRTLNLIIDTDSKYQRGAITTVERFQKVIDTWNNASDRLKKEVVEYFKNTDPLNSIYMMAFSGARGNISQVRQLVGMRGLMSDPQGQIIDLPISSNFREGLTVTDYFISSYGARKGLVDIALRTADSGYLTRRLVDVAQDIIVREVDCKTARGILLEDIIDNGRVLIRLEQLLIGRLLAEDLLHPLTNNVIAYAGQDIDDLLAEKIIAAGIAKVLVRSPITCDATSSVCQKCYGWNLAHGRLVDLGEAIGIIAAQSIGEPGTQLTMRTFHTGGVFTGELADKIYSPFDAIIRHPDKSLLITTRTRYGDEAYLVTKECSMILYSLSSRLQRKISLIKGALILADNSSKVLKNQLLVEYPLRSRLTTEKAQKVMTSDISGRISFSGLAVEQSDNKQQLVKSSQSGGLIWVLAGQVHNISSDADFVVREGTEVNRGDLLAVQKIASAYSGYIQIFDHSRSEDTQEIIVMVASYILTNITLNLDKYSGLYSYFLTMDNQDKFLLNIKPGDKILDGQIIGELVSDIYKTSTGGIIKYLDLQVSKEKDDLNNEYCNILGSGYVLWVPEETYELNKDLSLILVNHGDFIEKDTEIIKNIFAQNTGIVEIIEKDGIVREVIIKPCATYKLGTDRLSHHRMKKRGFLRPGEKIIGNISTNKLVYWECLRIEGEQILLIRPVIVYSIPNKVCTFKHGSTSFRPDLIYLTLIRRISFKDGTRVKSAQAVDLIKTYLTIGFSRKLSGLTYLADINHDNTFDVSLRFTAVDRVLVKYSKSIAQNDHLISRTRLRVLNNGFVYKSQIIAQTETLSNVVGQVTDLQSSHLSNRRFVILTSLDRRIYTLDRAHRLKINLGSWVLKGQEIAQGFYSPESGQIISISNDNAILRCARPYLVPNGSILHVDNNSLIRRGESIATLIFNRVKTGDIVQGLPRIEEILEARKKMDNDFNPHMLLENKFRFYLNEGLTLHDATRASFQEIQLVLIKEVQLVYQSQGVDISDKHIEVIVRQMTSKVKIEQGGDTSYLPGEMVDLRKIEGVNRTISLINRQTATYHPILLGITKASLNTESFISAASFQETTKVLTEAAISGKLDWLRGLKENVIIGRLIPAGTGFNSYSASTSKSSTDCPSSIASLSSATIDSESSFEDIIVDDRGARNLIGSRQQLNDLQPNQDIY